MRSEMMPATNGVNLRVLRWDGSEAADRGGDTDGGEVGGGAVPYLLVHGLSSNARLWSGVAAALAAQGHPVAAVDQRGHGRSDKPDTGYDYPTVVADLVAVMDALGWDRAVVAGQSWGGNVVVHLAARHPERLAGVACVDGGWLALRDSFPTWEACLERLTPPAIAGMARSRLAGFVRSGHPTWSEEAVEATLANMETLPDGSVRPWLKLDRHLAILRSMWEDDIWAAWDGLAVPAALLPADDGTGRQRAGVERAAALGRSVAVRWFEPPADHDLHAQQPGVVAEVLRGLA